jgi:hypothetical protein
MKRLNNNMFNDWNIKAWANIGRFFTFMNINIRKNKLTLTTGMLDLPAKLSITPVIYSIIKINNGIFSSLYIGYPDIAD